MADVVVDDGSRSSREELIGIGGRRVDEGGEGGKEWEIDGLGYDGEGQVARLTAQSPLKMTIGEVNKGAGKLAMKLNDGQISVNSEEENIGSLKYVDKPKRSGWKRRA